MLPSGVPDTLWVCVSVGFAACHAGSSEAILSGQKPPFRLLVRAMSRESGARLSNIRFAVSEPFVVSTPKRTLIARCLGVLCGAHLLAATHPLAIAGPFVVSYMT